MRPELSASQLVQCVAALLALFAGVAWMKSAFAQWRPDQKPSGWMDRQMNRISTSPVIWNVVAAALSALAAVAQAIALLVTLP